MRLKTKFSVGITVIVALAVVAAGGTTILSQRKRLRQEIESHHLKLIHRLARLSEEALYQGDLVFVNYVKGLREERGFLGAGFTDSNDLIQLHSDPTQINTQWVIPSLHQKNRPEPDIVQSRYDRSDGTPVLSYEKPVQFGGQELGTARLIFSENAIRTFLNESTFNDLKRIGFISLIVLAGSLFVVILFAGAMISPIEQLVMGMRAVSEGRLAPIPLKKREDELGWMGQELNATIKKLKELEDMKTNFFSRITHELKSPLIAVDGLVSMSLKGKAGAFSSKMMNWLLMIQNNNLRTLRLVNDLLTTTKLDAGSDKLDITKFNLNDLIQEAAQFFRPQAEEKNIGFHVTLPDSPLFLRADRDKAQHILNNLISNAVKFTETGRVTVTAATNSKKVHVEVADTGPGIKPDERTQIFNKFFRSPSTIKVKGTGLGLSIAKELAEAHNGTLTVKENPSGGTIFHLSLPL
jgi:signal transduction histidine kinase